MEKESNDIFRHRDRVNNENFYWLRDEHYADKKLWGDFVNNPMINPGRFSSYIRNRGLDFRTYIGNTEIGVQYLTGSPESTIDIEKELQ